MNREIKFKAWDKVTKLLVDLIGFKDLGQKIELWYWNKDNEKAYCVADKEYIELMQYTGLKDKNDKEIYEGDIIKNDGCDDGDLISVIIFDRGVFALKDEEDLPYVQYPLCEWNECCEVIGNIYENPELLKE